MLTGIKTVRVSAHESQLPSLDAQRKEKKSFFFGFFFNCVKVISFLLTTQFPPSDRIFADELVFAQMLLGLS